jgi:hypothetical protein
MDFSQYQQQALVTDQVPKDSKNAIIDYLFAGYSSLAHQILYPFVTLVGMLSFFWLE